MNKSSEKLTATTLIPHVKLGGSVYQAFVEFALTNVNIDELMHNIVRLNKYFNHSTLSCHKFKEAYCLKK